MAPAQDGLGPARRGRPGPARPVPRLAWWPWLLAESGLKAIDVATRPLERPLTPWLEQAQTGEAAREAAREAIRAALRADIAGDAVTGLRPRVNDDGELWFVQTFGSAIASKPS